MGTQHSSLRFKARGGGAGGGGGGVNVIFSVFTFDRAAKDEQVGKNGSKSDHAFLRYCVPKSEVYL